MKRSEGARVAEKRVPEPIHARAAAGTGSAAAGACGGDAAAVDADAAAAGAAGVPVLPAKSYGRRRPGTGETQTTRTSSYWWVESCL